MTRSHKGLPPIHMGMAFVVLAWSLNFAVVRLAYREWTPAALIFGRYLGTLPFMFILAASSGISLKAPLKRWPALLLSGALSSGLYMVLFLEGMKLTGAAQGAVTLATAPIFIALIGFFRKDDRPSWQWAAGSLLALAGVALTHAEGLLGKGSLEGFLLVLAASVVWAVNVHVMRPLIAEFGSMKAMTLSLPGALLVLIPYAGPAISSFPFGHLSLMGWGAILYLAFIAGALAFVAYYRAVQDLGPAIASLSQYVIPPAAAIFAVIILGDRLQAVQAAGLVLTLVGVALAQSGRVPAEKGKMEK